jgi:hypothetical protein
MYRIQNCSSVCTIKGAANALPSIKHQHLFIKIHSLFI